MVSPIYLLVIPLGTAFLISLLDKLGRPLTLALFYGALAAMTALAGSWLYAAFFAGGGTTVFTAGWQPPLSIALAMGPGEAFFTSAMLLAGLLAALVMAPRFRRGSVTAAVLFLMVILGAVGLVLTRDLFNLFVFLEISSIATYALIAVERNRRSLSAGFKYVIAGGIASALFLIGTGYVYRLTGSLALSDIAAAGQLFEAVPGFTAVFLVMAALLIELKPFPANGWALDVYQAAESGAVSVIAVVNSAGVLYALLKLMPALPAGALTGLMWVGILTFFFSNLLGLRQDSVKRLLGYSSAAQIGLVTAVAALALRFGFDQRFLLLTAGTIFISHLLAKAGLFWLTSSQRSDERSRWPGPAGGAGLLVFGILLFALAGLPPFPAFWAKWQLVAAVIGGAPWFTVLLLAGSLFEAVYLLRWFGSSVALRRASEEAAAAPEAAAPAAGKVEAGARGGSETAAPTAIGTSADAESGPDVPAPAGLDPFPLRIALPAGIAAVLLAAAGLFLAVPAGVTGFAFFDPLISGAAVLLLARRGNRFAGLVGLALIAFFGYWFFPGFEGLRPLFFLVFTAGGAAVYLGSLYRRPSSSAFYPLLTALVLSLGGLPLAESFLEFFFLWELMTVSSYLLVLLGRRGERPALSYITFSLGGAFVLMSGLALAVYSLGGESGTALAAALRQDLPAGAAGAVFLLLTVGFLVKIGAAGVHIWLPGSYAETDDTASGMLSAVLSKAGIFGLFAFALVFAGGRAELIDLPLLLRWLGAVTALIGSLLAVFQEDIKRLLAYSSMGQLGYIILGFGLMTGLGWTTGIYLTVLHLMFKGILFLAAAGVIYRTGTRSMYRMGGLIKKMPISFITVLIGIIAVSGVPPLAGFGGKWLLYTSLMEHGSYLLTGVAFFSGTLAFLYLFRLIHTVFLGQLKVEHRGVREAPLLLIIPQLIFMLAIMAVSSFPRLLMGPAQAAAGAAFPAALEWEGFTAVSSLGYFNGPAVMTVTMAVFALILIWLLIVQRRPQTVKQFNIVFAAERPHRPETSHFAYNFFAPYRKALGFLTEPLATRLWGGISEAVGAVGGALRRVYTGNGQTYALHILLFVGVLYFLIERL
jgi:formate hydrogenlyase subunit 3/multisubunit Na+/H+ antiporter MnhD subunit